MRLRVFPADVAYGVEGTESHLMHLAESSNQTRKTGDRGRPGGGMTLLASRDPRIHVRLHTRNPFAWVSAVRLALRLSGIDGTEIDRFTEEALRRNEPGRMRDVCAARASFEVVS